VQKQHERWKKQKNELEKLYGKKIHHHDRNLNFVIFGLSDTCQ
jgi:hypothetical protein